MVLQLLSDTSLFSSLWFDKTLNAGDNWAFGKVVFFAHFVTIKNSPTKLFIHYNQYQPQREVELFL